MPTNSSISTLLLIGHGSRDEAAIAEYNQFADALSTRLHIPVRSCFLEFADPPIAAAIKDAVESGSRAITALPLFIGPAGHQKNDVPTIINWAREQYPEAQFAYGTPIGIHYGVVRTMADRVQQALDAAEGDVPAEETVVLVVGRGSRDPDSNSDIYKMSRLLQEGRDFASVETCFYALTDPPIAESIARCEALGARRVVVLPYLLFTGRIRQRIEEQVAEAQANHPDLDILVSGHLSIHEGLLDAVQQRYEEALSGVAAMTCDACKYRHQFTGFESEFGMPQSSDHNHGLRGVPHDHGIAAGMDSILPPRYQGETEISAAPMGAAGLKYADDGSVAWDEIWEDFCDLALAGGPPHRGDLLEPPTAEVIRLNPAGYERTLDELRRGLTMITDLPIVESKSPGWIGIECHSEEMAVWMLRAIIVENVMVRREGPVLYLPAGPAYTLSGEIKNVITVVAKTTHYWQEHMAAQQVRS